MKADIRHVVEEIRKEKGIEAVYLFGSAVSGKKKPYSDIDICVVTGEGADEEKILSNSSEKIDTSLFWKLPLNVRFRVMKYGKPLFVKDMMKMQRTAKDTVLAYLDFKPLLSRYNSRFLS